MMRPLSISSARLVVWLVLSGSFAGCESQPLSPLDAIKREHWSDVYKACFRSSFHTNPAIGLYLDAGAVAERCVQIANRRVGPRPAAHGSGFHRYSSHRSTHRAAHLGAAVEARLRLIAKQSKQFATRMAEIDITLCPLCGGQLRVIGDTDPDLIRKILDHVQNRAPPRLPPRRAEPGRILPDLFAER